ncbi:MAG: thrombospondin type 3 repeat-containing protein [Haloarculaceae archaeon]
MAVSWTSRPVVTVLAMLVLVAAAATVWNVAAVREHQATDAKTTDLVNGTVTARQAPADYDGDGVPDQRDACPTRPETNNGFQDGDGCPDVVATTGAS